MSIRERDLALISKTNTKPPTDVVCLKGVLAAHAALIAQLAQIKPKLIRGGAADDIDLEARAAHMTAVAEAVDRYFLALGQDTKSACNEIDLAQFTEVVFGAIDGFALHELTSAAEQWVEDNGQFGVGG